MRKLQLLGWAAAVMLGVTGATHAEELPVRTGAFHQAFNQVNERDRGDLLAVPSATIGSPSLMGPRPLRSSSLAARLSATPPRSSCKRRHRLRRWPMRSWPSSGLPPRN
jgi:hypothetical protein